MNVRRDRVIEEMERKAEKIALRWFHKNYAKVYQNPRLNPEQVPKNAAKLYDEIVMSRKRLLQWQKDNEAQWREERRPGRKAEDGGSTSYTVEELTRGPMYPVPKEVLDELFSGVSHNSEGRIKYLSMRYDVSPENRYYDPPSGNQEYGWDIKNRAWKSNKEHARSSIVKKSFYRRTGALDGDDPMRKPPFTSGHISMEIL